MPKHCNRLNPELLVTSRVWRSLMASSNVSIVVRSTLRLNDMHPRSTSKIVKSTLQRTGRSFGTLAGSETLHRVAHSNLRARFKSLQHQFLTSVSLMMNVRVLHPLFEQENEFRDRWTTPQLPRWLRWRPIIIINDAKIRSISPFGLILILQA